MKIGILGCKNYPTHKDLNDLISQLFFLYRPFGNMDDEYEEPIEILYMRYGLDCGSIIKKIDANFTIAYFEDVNTLIEESDLTYVFAENSQSISIGSIQRLIDNRKHFEVIFSKEEKNV